jgi:hypothetical protein
MWIVDPHSFHADPDPAVHFKLDIKNVCFAHLRDCFSLTFIEIIGSGHSNTAL